MECGKLLFVCVSCVVSCCVLFVLCCVMFVVCQWPYVPSLGSIGQVQYEIQQKCFVRMRSSDLDLSGEKHFGIKDPSFQVNAQWPKPSFEL